MTALNVLLQRDDVGSLWVPLDAADQNVRTKQFVWLTLGVCRNLVTVSLSRREAQQVGRSVPDFEVGPERGAKRR
jgi:hypothetical protein